ncbi:helix-turn-helix domain-containing protein [Streptomyces sp. NPDC059637]|uniref:helix-turn-helix domain-containing protein n=1 Tax=Streptomyces TaxID=1883 RepID=UPI0031D15B66
MGTQNTDIDWGSFGDLKDAARSGHYGLVIRKARTIAGLTQGQLGTACGLSQAAISRLENRDDGTYNMNILANAATALGLPFELVGLANQNANGLPVERREFLTAVVAAAAQPIKTVEAAVPRWDNSPEATLRISTSSLRRLDSTVASRDLSESALTHLRLIQTIAREAPDDAHRARLASAGSEAASFAGWLSWDMADHGSARRWYGSAIKAANHSGDRLLTAYQTGSLASFEADTGSPTEALRLVMQTRHHLGPDLPPLAAAWLSSIEATAHAANGHKKACDRALLACEQQAALIPDAEPVAWPWIFAFDERKTTACRITCTAHLGQPLHTRLSESDIATALSSSHDKQRALLTLDVALGHLATKEIDAAFTLGIRALETGIRLRSGKITERARRLRRAYSAQTPPSIVRDFDDQLHSAYL